MAAPLSQPLASPLDQDHGETMDRKALAGRHKPEAYVVTTTKYTTLGPKSYLFSVFVHHG